MSDLHTTPKEHRLTFCLWMVLIAPTEELADLMFELLGFCTIGLTEIQIEGCKLLALRMQQEKMFGEET